LSMPDDATFVRVLRAAAELNWPVSVHVANSSIDDALRAELIAQGRRRARDVCLMTRSPESAEAQARIIHFAQVTGARLHIAHLSYNAMEALEGLRIARERGTCITAEIAPPCLSFADLDRLGAFGTPFAHADEENDRYWNALRDGIIDAVATDHAPHTREEKLKGEPDAWLAPTGYPAVETMLPLLVDAALRGRLKLERVVAIAAENPARICSFESKGSIAIGKDADLAIVDPAAEWVIEETKLHSKAGWSPFHGRRLRGRIRYTFLRGNQIACDGELIASAPCGRLIRATATDPIPGTHTRSRPMPARAA
jgi:dihydroorotase